MTEYKKLPSEMDLFEDKIEKVEEHPKPKEEVKYTKEQKKEVIEKWNEHPINKINGIEAREREGLLKKIAIGITIFFGIVALLVIAGSVGVYSYIAFQDGTLISPLNAICLQNITINEKECPDNTANCGNCDVKLNMSCPVPLVNVYVNGS